jgi:hypothetical protein
MSWIQTYTGHPFDFANPSQEAIWLEDIAHALSMQCRYNGHCRRFYSIAEHSYWASIRAADLAAEKTQRGEIKREHGIEIALAALMHDAAEAYVGDMVKPLKSMSGLEMFTYAETLVIEQICKKYPFPTDPIANDIVHQADMEMLAIEKRDVMGPCARPWEGLLPIPEPNYVEIGFWAPDVAKARWLIAAKQLGLRG